MEYEHKPGGVIRGRDDGPAGSDIPILFSASQIRRERTGVHARVAVKVGNTAPTYTTFNIERDEERVRLANSAHRRLNGAGDILNPEEVKRALDEFCFGLWEAHTGKIVVERVSGKRNRTGPRWVMEPYLLREAGTILFAPPGRGKSTTALGMAITVDAGLENSPFGRTVEPIRTMYVNIERGRDSMADRLAAMNVAMGLPEDRELTMINARGKRLFDIIEVMAKRVEEEQYGLVVLDSISRAGYGDLNENAVANRIVDELNGLGVCWLGIAHTPRGDETHIFGSQHFDAGADVTVAMGTERDGETGNLGIVLRVDKANDIKYPPPRFLAYEFTEDGLSQLRLADAGEFSGLVEGVQTLRAKVVGYLREVGKASATEIAQELSASRTKVVEILNGPEFVKLAREARRQPYGLAAPQEPENPPQRGQQSQMPQMPDCIVCGAAGELYGDKGEVLCSEHG